MVWCSYLYILNDVPLREEQPRALLRVSGSHKRARLRRIEPVGCRDPGAT